MSLVPFDLLPDDARLWIFPADRRLTAEERLSLSRAVEESLAGWSAHGSAVRWGYAIAHDQVLVVGVDEGHTALTGCSIDNCVRRVRALEGELGLSLLDNGRVFFRRDGELTWVDRPRFGELARAGEVTLDTVVHNNVIGTVGAFRAGRWEVAARDSWHADAFPLAS